MKGSIRIIVGLVLLMGAAGGLDKALDSQLPSLLLVAVLGLVILTSGVRAVKSQ
jgi:hypothetical protein